MHLFCFGLGYAASVVSKNLTAKWKVSGTHRGGRALKENEYLFAEGVDFDDSVLADVTHILISIPPTGQGDPVFLRLAERFKTLKSLKWIGYFSSSAVYGDHHGAWVNEVSEARPFEAMGKNRLLAEEQWLASNLPVNIMRLAAIYGPGRSAIESVRAGKATCIVKKNHYFSRIHVQDLARMTVAIMMNPRLGEIYNIADDSPSPNHQVIAFACELLGVAPPEKVLFKDANLSEGMANYYRASRRVDNTKIKNDYALELNFPSYIEGLRGILSAE